MQLSEDEINKNYIKHCGYCNRNTLLPNEYERTCISCGCNVIKRKHELSRIQRKRINLINRLKYAEFKIFCICVEVYKFQESEYYAKLFENLSTLKNKKLKTNSILIKDYKYMLENPEFEQEYSSRTATGFYKVGHNSIRLMKWLAYYD